MVNSIGSHASYMAQRSTQLAQQMLSKIDTKNQGFIDSDELTTALTQLQTGGSASSTSTASATGSTSPVSAADIFKQLDANGDGKISQDELASGLQKMMAQMKGHHGHHMHGAGAPPPVSTSDDQTDDGVTKDDLTSIIAQSGTTASKRTDKLQNILDNFSQIDTNGDGKITRTEMKAFREANKAAGATDSQALASQTSNPTKDQVLQMISQLMKTYGYDQNAQAQTMEGNLSIKI